MGAAPSAAQASLTAAISSKTVEVAAGQERAAVDDHVDLVGAGLDGVAGVGELDRQRLARPEGNAVATAATWMPVPPSASRGDARPGRRRRRRRRPAGMVGSRGSGRSALAHSERTLPGVSAPSSVVRSIIEMAVSIAQALAVVLIERVPSAGGAGLGADLVDPGQAVQPGRQGGVGQRADAEQVARSGGGGGGAHRRSLARPHGLAHRRPSGWLRPAIAGRSGRRTMSAGSGPARSPLWSPDESPRT